MAQEIKHTQGKWIIPSKPYPIKLKFGYGHPEFGDRYLQISIFSESGKHICEKIILEGLSTGEAEANAELICKAVNNHDKLMEMLRLVLKEKYQESNGSIENTEIENMAETLLESLK